MDERRRRKLGLGIGVPVAIVVLLLALSIINVPAGHKAAVIAGVDVGAQFDEGWQLKNPFSTVEMVRYNTQILVEQISVRSADGYNVDIDFAIRYHLMENRVGEIRKANPDYRETVIRSILRSQARIVVSNLNLTGEDMNNQRAMYEGEVEIAVKAQLSEYYIAVEDVMLRNLDFPDKIDQAWQDRASAQVDIETAGYELEAERLRAQKELMRAEAERNSTIVIAEGQAIALEVLENQSIGLNETLMNYILSIRYIAALRDPDSNVNFVVLPHDGPSLILNVPETQIM